MLTVTMENEQIRIGERFSFSMYRTLRVPDDGLDRPLPAGLGALPVHRASDYPGRVPPAWRRSEDLFSPLHRWESLWIGFRAAAWKPNAVKVAVGGISAITGAPEDGRLRDDPQDYLVCPPQPWLDGVNLGGGVVRQFVSAPIGAGETVEARLTGREVVGGLRVTVFEPRPGLFPDRPPEPSSSYEELPAQTAGTLGLGAGGRLRQKIYPDPYGLDAWDQGNLGTVVVHLVTAEDYQALTGREPPPHRSPPKRTPVRASPGLNSMTGTGARWGARPR